MSLFEVFCGSGESEYEWEPQAKNLEKNKKVQHQEKKSSSLIHLIIAGPNQQHLEVWSSNTLQSKIKLIFENFSHKRIPIRVMDRPVLSELERSSSALMKPLP